ncbi:serine/threonine-protein kinase [Haliangium ochraceum]|uniref:Serine/threonine protein kinase n=1 Tax=Haliangium ochraceum (strain DSM 14365 / JCM 11303 / SMP-2) TaxID=502025 RepID=D0LS61_HALO1|nr:serine/threonine-protein kinase [Haliangium ochraceum]ACY13758.1 serine/threonine protein kinase [Haliangium ochraceum DSM 14365]
MSSPLQEVAATSPARYTPPPAEMPLAALAEAAPAAIAPGARIGQYELIRELGRGGMGAVFVARDLRLGRRVAIKFLHSGNPEFTARFLIEARATAQCHHDNIIVIHDVGEHGSQPYMVLELLSGSPLSGVVRTGEAMPAGRVVELMVPVVRALVCAHEHGIVHRDLKPENIFLTDAGTIKVLDFGLAKVATEPGALAPGSEPLTPERLQRMARGEEAVPALTKQGAVMGTLPFMSPEQWEMAPVDHRTDVWAIGVMLFEMLAGQHPLHPAKGWEFMNTAVMEQPFPRIRSVRRDVPDELAALVDHCLIKDQQQRVGSARQLLERLAPLLPGRVTHRLRADQCPYPGLGSFQESDAGRFFGRTREIAAATARLRDQPLLGVVGPSGAGKSSFVRAGVVPALKQAGESWTSLVIRPGRQPMQALAHLVTGLLTESEATLAVDLLEQREAAGRLRAEPGYLGAVLRSHARQRGTQILLFVDQFEELYTLVDDPAERLAFTAALAGVADDATAPLRVVLALRSDFLDRVSEDAYFLAELSRGLFFLAAPAREGLRDAIVQPAEMAGYRFESDEIVEHMLRHLEDTEGALPLLQFAASQLWDSRDTGKRLLTSYGYNDLGGITGALARHADRVLAELPAQDQILARALLLHLVTPERTRAVMPLDELTELVATAGAPPVDGAGASAGGTRAAVGRLVEHLVNARLLVVQTGEGGTTVELVHESLIHGWPRLMRWLDESQEDAHFLAELRAAARQWDTRRRPGGLLWRGEAAAEARRFAQRFRGELPLVQREFLHAVLAHDTRAARRKQTLVAGVIVTLLALVAAAAVALVLIRDAQKEAVAQAAETERQLERARQAEAAAQIERERALSASDELARNNDLLAANNEELIAAVQAAEKARREAETAREAAEDAKNEARSDRQRAVAKETEARAAETRAQAANTRLQRLLEQERARVRRLEEQGTSHVINDVGLEQ